MILVTGGAGFIGANFVLDWLREVGRPVLTLDKLTYAGNLENLAALAGDARHLFVRGDICDRPLVDRLLDEHRPKAIVHFAAESHVDRSIHGPGEFVRTNIEGTFTLLEAARAYWNGLEGTASDHLVRAYHHTYGLPVLTTNCSNNYGPYQFPEKLIPLVIANALAGKALPIYGDGMNVRDWLYVGDHCAAIRAVLAGGRLGETYNIGGWNEMPNLVIVRTICALLDELRPDTAGPYERLISYVKDRPGHDRRYAIDARKIERELGWRPAETFETGIRRTVRWYLGHQEWVQRVQSGAYREWVEQNYGERG